MKKRLAKKIEKMRRKKVHEALEIVLEINTTQARAQSKTGCKPTAFFEFDGHVGGMGFAVHPDGWKKWGSSPVEFKERFILNQFQTPKQAEAFIILILNLKIRAELEIVATKLASEL